jgi:hypothetical protein
MKKVFKFKIYDINSDAYKVSQKWATREYIENIKGAVVMVETEKDMEESMLDERGLQIDKWFQ